MSDTEIDIDEVDALAIEHSPRRLAEMVVAERRSHTSIIAAERASATHTLRHQVGRALGAAASEHEWDGDVRSEINSALEDLDIKMTQRHATGTVTITVPITARATNGRNDNSWAGSSTRVSTTEAYNDNGDELTFGLDSDWEDVSFDASRATISFDLDEEDDDE